MFNDVFVENAGRRPWTLAASLLLQSGLIGLLILVPLLTTGALPRLLYPICILTPPPGEERDGPPPVQHAAVRESTNVREVRNGRLIEPVAIPPRVTPVTDAASNNAAAPGLPTGIAGVPGGTGSPDSRILNLLDNHAAAPPPPPVRNAEPPMVRHHIGGDVQAAMLISRPTLLYPPLARAAGISGVVRLVAYISETGAIEELRVVDGHPLLVRAAVEAVKQWRYRPTILNGNPVKVETTIEVIFNLNR